MKSHTFIEPRNKKQIIVKLKSIQKILKYRLNYEKHQQPNLYIFGDII